MKEAVWVCGSIAEDIIGTAQASSEQTQEARVEHPATPLTSLVRRWGGCALNVCVGLGQLGVPAVPVATVGRDYTAGLRGYLQSLGISEVGIHLDASYPRQATGIMIGSPQRVQRTYFHAGPSDSVDHPRLAALPHVQTAAWVLVAPIAPATALQHLRDAEVLGIRTMFDPGQCLSRFTSDEIAEALSLTTRLILNAEEWALLQDGFGPAARELASTLEAVIVTDGPGPVRVTAADSHFDVRPPVAEAVDETGCGDAFRAAYVSGLIEGLDERAAIERGCCLGAQCAETVGAHHFVTDPATLDASRLKAYPQEHAS